MDVVNLQMVKGALVVWTFAWTVKLLVSGQAKDVALLAKKVVKIGVKIDVKILVKEIVNLVHKRTLLQVALEE